MSIAGEHVASVTGTGEHSMDEAFDVLSEAETRAMTERAGSEARGWTPSLDGSARCGSTRDARWARVDDDNGVLVVETL